MAVIRETADNSLGAISMGKGKSLKIWLEDGRRVVQLVDDAMEDILDIMPEVESVWHNIKSLFDNMFNSRFPCVIIHEGSDYIYTIQPAPWKGIDKVMYLNTEKGELHWTFDYLFMHEHANLQEAKNMLYRELKERGYAK
jgi:hypothetical protein